MSSMDSSEVSSSPRLDTLLALIQESNKDSLPVDIYVLKQEGFNAFAAPGLQIFVLESVLDVFGRARTLKINSRRFYCCRRSGKTIVSPD